MDSAFLFIILLAGLVLGFGVVILLLNKKLSVTQNDNSSVLLQNQLNSLVNNLDRKLSETNKIVNDHLSFSNDRLQSQNATNNELLNRISENNNRILKEVTEKLVKVEDTNKQVVNFAEQLQSLENILKHPKQRGVLGEYFLETILSNVLPKSVYTMQHSFHDGVIVDAAIFTKDKIIPIDAKFSLETYDKILKCTDKEQVKLLEKEFINGIKKRIDETSKYVKPEEGTIDVAFMFVPSDSVYQEVIRIGFENTNNGDLITYAFSKRVVMVSPTSFFAYLQTLLKALNSLQIEEKVQEIIVYLNQSTKYLKEFEEEMNKLSKNISALNNTFNRTSDSARKLSSRIAKITSNQDNVIGVEKIENHVEN